LKSMPRFRPITANKPIDAATRIDEKINASRWNLRKFIDVSLETSLRRIGKTPS
jgi:hypothetical protein